MKRNPKTLPEPRAGIQLLFETRKIFLQCSSLKIEILKMTTATNGSSRLSWFQRLELVCSGILFGAFNNITTILNAKVLFEEDRMAAGTLTIFFMLFPGVIISIGFLVLHWLGHRKIGRIPPFWVLIYFVLLFFFYPLVPIAL